MTPRTSAALLLVVMGAFAGELTYLAGHTAAGAVVALLVATVGGYAGMRGRGRDRHRWARRADVLITRQETERALAELLDDVNRREGRREVGRR